MRDKYSVDLPNRNKAFELGQKVKVVENMMADASINGKKYTNHSLCATGATSLFDAGIPEAIIQKRSGHHSTKALRMYERVTPD